MTRSLAVVLVLAGLLAACRRSDRPANADVEDIRAPEARWVRAWAAKDVDGVLAYYADDASVELADTPLVKGKDAIRRGVVSAFNDPGFSLSF